MKKKNILFIVIDSVTNDILFNKSNSKDIAPFLYSLRDKTISGDKMYSEAPYTEAALMSLLGSIDTMDNGGYMERMKNTRSVLEVFKENKYKVFFNNYYPSIYPSYMVRGYDEKRYIEGFQFIHLWEYRFKYFSKLYLEGVLSNKEKKMLIDMLEDNFKGWILYLEKLRDNDLETELLNGNIDIKNIEKDIKKLNEEYNKFVKNSNLYLKELFIKGEEHILFKIKNYNMTDKIHSNSVRNEVRSKYYDTFKRIDKLNRRKNLLNNGFPCGKIFRSIIRKEFGTIKGLLAGYKNSLFDKDLYDRIEGSYDLFKVQRSFHTVSENFFKWLDKNKDSTWMSYIHVDDAHFNESIFTYDTDDLELIDEEFGRINNYLNELPIDYKGSITYDLSLMYCDNVIKNIFKYLEKNKLIDNTAIVITADHGFSYYFSPVREKYVISNYKENYNVPFIVYSKDLKKREIKGFCATKDIPSTLVSLAGINIPKYFKGKNLLTFDGREYATIEYMGGGCPDIKRRPINLGVRTDNYSVVLNLYINKEFCDGELVEVYDLKNDKYENNNLNSKKNINSKIMKELDILEKRFLELKMMYKDSEEND